MDDLFLIRPSPVVNQVLLYLLILKANRYGLLIHGFCFLSNHFHLVVTDVAGHLPAFMREFLGESSKAIQVATHSDRAIWSRKRYSDVKLLDLDAAERKLVYALLNPSRAGLTSPSDWPGLTSAGLRCGDTIEALRPEMFFSRKRSECVSASLEPVSLPFESPLEESELRIGELLQAGIEECRRGIERRGGRLLGREGVLAASRDRRGRRRVRHLNPRFASRDRGLLAAAVASAREFENDHEEAKQSYIAGQRNVCFPAGTYGYRTLLGVRVAKHGEAA